MNITKIPIDFAERNNATLESVLPHGEVPYDFTSKKIPSHKGNFREVKSSYFERIAQKTKGNFRVKKENTVVQSSNRMDNVNTSEYAWIDKNCER